MEISETQKLYSKYISESNHPRVGAFIALVEEIGEIAKEILSIELYDETNKKNKLEEEVADTFIALLEFCDVYHINLEDVFIEKFNKIKIKAETEWKNNLTEILEKKRDIFDSKKIY